MRVLSITAAKARLSEIVARLVHRKETIVITRKKAPVAALVPYEEWAAKEAESDRGLAAAAGALSEFDADIDVMITAIDEARAKAWDRKIVL